VCGEKTEIVDRVFGEEGVITAVSRQGEEREKAMAESVALNDW